MSRNVEAKTNAARLLDFERALCKHLDEFEEDAQRLDRAYRNAEWNDMVSESVRMELNEYIDKLNRALAKLDGVILAVGEMQRIAEEYERI